MHHYRHEGMCLSHVEWSTSDPVRAIHSPENLLLRYHITNLPRFGVSCTLLFQTGLSLYHTRMTRHLQRFLHWRAWACPAQPVVPVEPGSTSMGWPEMLLRCRICQRATIGASSTSTVGVVGSSPLLTCEAGPGGHCQAERRPARAR